MIMTRKIPCLVSSADILTDIRIYCCTLAALGPFSNIKGLTFYRNNDEDPYITMKGNVRIVPISKLRSDILFRMKKMNAKSFKSSPRTTSLSSPKPKTKSPNSKFTSTTNQTKISSPITTLCSHPFPYASNGLICLPFLHLQQNLRHRIPPQSNSGTISLWGQWSQKLRCGH